MQASEKFNDKNEIRNPGDKYLIFGPTSYVPPLEASILSRRKRIPLKTNEGIYVRNIRTGNIRTVKNQT